MNGNIEVIFQSQFDLLFRYFTINKCISCLTQKLTQIHIETKTTYLHDMVQSNENVHALKAKDALLWLKRALQLIERFFSNILSDENQGENLKNHFHEAYRVTLSQYHNFIVRKLFAVSRRKYRHLLNRLDFDRLILQVVYGFLPQRSQLIGRDEVHVENVRLLDDFVRDMRLNLQQIDNIIAQ